MKLPEGLALDADGKPTTDPQAAWFGQALPIGAYKGAGLAMGFEILSCVLSANRFSTDIPSIVDNPQLSAGSSVFMLVINPQAISEPDDFVTTAKRYVDFVESSPAREGEPPPRYPGRREGRNWQQRSQQGIPVSKEALKCFDEIAQSLSLEPLS